ncbi:uncharacterized protein LOC106674306 [Cimex lectularius]|uniref:Uncharacterized protein n=1 Tax=Cimex lectularius TaxID=79782 RepID=A0A8I6SB34_CIMLE|nr:uncharacterized protein LOC106674306 [Cimex lectularius]
MKVAIFTLAVIAAVNAAVLPSQTLGVTKDEIDELVKEALDNYLKKLQKDGVHFGRSPLLPLELKDAKLYLQLLDLEGHVSELPTYEESSTLTDTELDLSLKGSFKNFNTKGQLSLTGSVKGKPFLQKGDVVMSWEDVDQDVFFKAVYDSKSVTVTDMKFDNDFKVNQVKLTGLDVEGVTEQELEEAVQKATNKFVQYVESEVHHMDWAGVLNQFFKGKNLDQVYQMLKLLLTSS